MSGVGVLGGGSRFEQILVTVIYFGMVVYRREGRDMSTVHMISVDGLRGLQLGGPIQLLDVRSSGEFAKVLASCE